MSVRSQLAALALVAVCVPLGAVLASGLVMGLGFVTGAIGVPINGAIGDAIGLQKSLMTHVILVIVTIGIAWFLPREEEIERQAMKPEPAT